MKEYFAVMRVFFIVIIKNAVYNTEVSFFLHERRNEKRTAIISIYSINHFTVIISDIYQ